VGLPQLEELSSINERRAQHAAVLTDGLSGIAGLVTPTVRDGDRHVFHQYTVRINNGARSDRDVLQATLSRAGIGTAVYYRNLVFERAWFRELPAIIIDECPVAAAMTDQVLSLPVHQRLSDGDLSRIIDSVRAALT
jgi:dTDP-4-amino-4,6-dideoxygalactose transaminase